MTDEGAPCLATAVRALLRLKNSFRLFRLYSLHLTGESRVVDDLQQFGYRDLLIVVLDNCPAALEVDPRFFSALR
jgi:hypothetical protein